MVAELFMLGCAAKYGDPRRPGEWYVARPNLSSMYRFGEDHLSGRSSCARFAESRFDQEANRLSPIFDLIRDALGRT